MPKRTKKEILWAELLHDLKSPMQSIEFALRNNAKSAIFDVRKINLANLELIEAFLGLYSSKKEEKILINTLDIIQDNIKHLQYLIKEKNIKIIFKGDSFQVITNPFSLSRIFLNILSNAIKYSLCNTCIKIEFDKDNALISFINTKGENHYITSKLGKNIIKKLAQNLKIEINEKEEKYYKITIKLSACQA